MRSIFDDIKSPDDLDIDKSKRSIYVPLTLWAVAIVFLVGVWSVYRWAAIHPAVEQPPPPVSLEDVKQTAETLGKFNHFIQDDKWGEAETMLSTAAVQKLKNENKSLRESMLGERKDQKILDAASTPSGEKSFDRIRQDCVYKFYDGSYIIVPIFLIIEDGKIVIDKWYETGPEQVQPKI